MKFLLCLVILIGFVQSQLDQNQMQYVLQNAMRCLEDTKTPSEFLTKLITGKQVDQDQNCFLGCLMGQTDKESFDPLIASERMYQHLTQFGVAEEKLAKSFETCGLYGMMGDEKCSSSLKMYNCLAREFKKK